MASLAQATGSLLLKEFVSATWLGDEIFLRAEGDDQLSLREGAGQPALPRRACAAPLSERRGALHRLQALRGDLPGAGDHHRGGPAPQRRHAPHGALRHRHGEVHLLRLSARNPARSTPSWRGRTSNSPRRRARSSTTTRRSCSRTATAGSATSPRTSRSTRRTGRRGGSEVASRHSSCCVSRRCAGGRRPSARLREPRPGLLPGPPAGSSHDPAAALLLPVLDRDRGGGVHGHRRRATRCIRCSS